MRAIPALFWISLMASVHAQSFPQTLFGEMQWRMIGPFRGGRTVAISGVPSQPNLFYMAPNNGGVWKTDDSGNTWRPIFDGQPTGSIGALAVSLSNPDIIYAGSGEGLQRPDLSVGDGMYKSTDAGKTWKHLGLREGQQIASILIDPHDPNRVFVAVLGHPYGPNEERGVFRSVDGGETWRKVLYKDENTGAIDLAFDPSNPRKIYASLWSARQTPWEANGLTGPGSGLFVSNDGGDTWNPLTFGLPEQGLGRIGIAIAPSDPRRMYAMVEAPREGGVYRSDNAGETWQRINSESRIYGRGSDFAWVRVDPKNKDTIYICNTSFYRSTDAGATFTAIKGAPGGDDYHTVWINPNNPDIMLLGVDQGATITVNGGQTWSSWYNQPTAQFYHVITDNRFPYWVYGAQQESGSAAVASRANDGEITFREFHPVGVEEYGYVAPDPLNPNIIYGGKATKFNQLTGDVQNISPGGARGGGGSYRFVRTMPLIFSTVDPHILYLGSNVLFKTINGGHSWTVISPDLTRPSYEVPKTLGIFTPLDPEKGKHRGVIYAIAPSRKDVNTIWAGTDDGWIQMTRDGGRSWKNVTPPDLKPWMKVSQLDGSYFDNETVYAAINCIRLDDLSPYIYRTHDGGKTWKKIVEGIPDDEVINTVREDPVRRGLLYAGSERAVYVSFDDGDHWESLRLNMPATSIRDLVIHGDDVVVGTHGRSFWILDDVTPLRQINEKVASSAVQLFKPQVAIRMRRDQNTDTPLPPEIPGGKNPPDGAILDYYLSSQASSPVTLEILTAQGKLVRKYSSDDKPAPAESDLNVPTYWIREPRTLSPQAGMHRFLWDFRYAPPEVFRYDYPISAIFHDTPRSPLGTLAMPGAYLVKLTVDGQSYTQPLTLKMDPRVKTPPSGLLEQYTLSTAVATMIDQDHAAIEEVRASRAKLQGSESSGAAGIADLQQKLAAIDPPSGGGGRGGRGGGAPGAESLTRLNGELAALFGVIEGSDETPTTQTAESVAALRKSFDSLMARWRALKSDLQKAGMAPL